MLRFRTFEITCDVVSIWAILLSDEHSVRIILELFFFLNVGFFSDLTAGNVQECVQDVMSFVFNAFFSVLLLNVLIV